MMKQIEKSADVIIIGGGFMGLLQALCLAKHSLTSIVIDKNDNVEMMNPKFDGRTSAITSASLNMLSMLNLDSALLGEGQDIVKILVRDGNDGPPIIFNENEPLAKVYENQKLRHALLQNTLNNEAITCYFSVEIKEYDVNDHKAVIALDNDMILSAPLIIGADGRNSEVRQNAGITLSQWQYEHHALVGAISHEKPHNDIAYELFFNEGPLALLPMSNDDKGNYRSSLIWSVPTTQHSAYQKLSSAIFCHELNKKSGNLLGECTLANPLISYPLGFHSANSLTAKRTALIGDSAHRVHPIAGQGLNLGIRDVAALTEILVEGSRIGLDCGDAQLLDRYERWRSVDTLSVSVATDSINHIYAMRGKAVTSIRRMGMKIVEKSDIIKEYLMLEARGASGELPKMLTGATI